jgi:dynein heavy chain
MFAMELHRFSDVIADITGSATKELSIEKGIDYYISTSISMFTTISKKRNQNVDA